MPDLTPGNLTELRRLYEVAFAVAAPENDWEEWTSKAAEAFPALLDAAAECDALRTERDALAAAVERVRALHQPEPFEMPNGDIWYACKRCSYAGDRPCPTVRALTEET